MSRSLLCFLLFAIGHWSTAQSAHDVPYQARKRDLKGNAKAGLTVIESALLDTPLTALHHARLLEALGEHFHRLSDIGEAKKNWDEALHIREQVFGDSSAEAAVGYAYQARYHDYMAAPQPGHNLLARREAERAKHLLKACKGDIDALERVLILREYGYAFKVSESQFNDDWHSNLRRTRGFYREALYAATLAHDTIWIAQVTHDIGNTFTDEAGRYRDKLPKAELNALADSGLTLYRRSIALMTAAGFGTSEAVMMDHLTTGLMYHSAWESDSSSKAINAYDEALRTMLEQVGNAPNVDPLTFDPRISNKAQMIELLYLRALSFASKYEDHTDIERVTRALKSFEAAVPYWQGLLKEYRSHDIQKVLGSYGHFPFEYGAWLAGELFMLTGDSSRLRQAVAWSDRNRDALEQRDLLRAGAKPDTMRSNDVSTRLPTVRDGSFLIAFHDSPRLIAFVFDHAGAHVVRLEKANDPVFDLIGQNQQLRAAMRANDIPAYQRIAFSIYRKTLGPLLENEHAQDLILVPSGPLGFTPFEALVTDTLPASRWSDLHFVQNTTRIRYARSVAEAMRPDIQLPYAPMIFVTANAPGHSPLPFAHELAAKESRQQGGQPPVENATCATFMHLMHGSTVLQLATHAEVASDPDALPDLLLNDGILTISDIDSIHCTAPLVVLSTCSSGEGRVYIGEGAMSLGHAFLRSGASAVVQTLWPVDDQATSEVLGLMYDGMGKGLSASDALAEAKRTFVKTHADGALSNPFYWSGIVITGVELRPAQHRKGWVWWTSAAVALLIGGYLYSKRTKRSRAFAPS